MRNIVLWEDLGMVKLHLLVMLLSRFEIGVPCPAADLSAADEG
jgi:hypothetical protein